VTLLLLSSVMTRSAFARSSTALQLRQVRYMPQAAIHLMKKFPLLLFATMHDRGGMRVASLL